MCVLVKTFFFTSFLGLSLGSNPTLKFVQIVFRHGQRTLDTYAPTYPNDPNQNASYYPYGKNQLTLEGQQTMYQLGTVYRTRYRTFLGDRFFPDLVKGLSSYYDRTKASLELVLAALFPPLPDQIIAPGLNWQPIPADYVTKENDRMFLPMLSCPNFLKQLPRYFHTSRYQHEYEKDKELFQYITKNSGRLYNNYYDVLYFHGNLKTQVEWGLTLPRWVQEIFPETIDRLIQTSYRVLCQDPLLARILTGGLLQQVISDAKLKATGDSCQNLKLSLYSAHDTTIVTFLDVLELFYPVLPSYGTSIILELHEIDHVYGFKIFYQHGVNSTAQLLKLPQCGEFCPLANFSRITKHLLPQPGDCLGTSGQRLNCHVYSSVVILAGFLLRFI